MNQKDHWEKVYQSKRPEEVSWYKPNLNVSLDLILKFAASENAKIIDVGGGTSTLVDDLLAKNRTNVTVLDLSGQALKTSKERLGKLADKAIWIEGDITNVQPQEHSYDLWHDRAVFHFLARPEDRKRYMQNLNHTLKAEGVVIISTFSLKGSDRCSGLDVVKYSPETLQTELGNHYRLIRKRRRVPSNPFWH